MNSAPTPSKESPPGLGTASLTEAPARRPRLTWTAFLAFAVVVLAAVAGLLPRWKAAHQLRAETSDLIIPNVVVVSPQAAKTPSALTLPAEIRPWMEAPIYARANGYLKRWIVDLGTKVEAGELLAEIDTPELNQELAQARAELARAQAALALARITAERWADLLKTASVSEQEAAEKQSDLALKSAMVDAAQASVRRLEELQSFARVTAPFAGTITARRTDVGELIAPGTAKELFRLAQTNPLRVYVRVPQSVARQIAVGQIAEVTIPEIPGSTFRARVVRTSGVMDAQSRTLLTELELDNTSGVILAGSYAQVRFPEAKSLAALTLPSNALLFRPEGPQAGVVSGDGTVDLRVLKLGRDFGPIVEVLDGVNLADRVILNPSDSLAPGVKVRVSGASEPALAKSPATQKETAVQ